MTRTVFAGTAKTQSPVAGLPEFVRTALTGASESCYWAMSDPKKDHDSGIGVDGTSLCVYYGGELARGDREQVRMGNLGLTR